jgi:hypothetical protein
MLSTLDKILTVVLALGAVVVLFECAFRALRDFNGIDDD